MIFGIQKQSSFESHVKLIFRANLRTQHELFPSFEIHSAGHSRDPLLRNTLSIWSQIQQKNHELSEDKCQRRQVTLSLSLNLQQIHF